MEEITPRYDTIILVCTNNREDDRESCSQKGSCELRDRLKAEVKEQGLAGKIRVSQSGCQDLCAQGAIVSVYAPAGRTVYSKAAVEDIAEIVKKASS